MFPEISVTGISFCLAPSGNFLTANIEINPIQTKKYLDFFLIRQKKVYVFLFHNDILHGLHLTKKS